MAPQFARHVSKLSARRRRSPNGVRLRCEQLEDRVTPALFNVQTPLQFSGMNNNGFVGTADLNKDGRMDAVFTNFGDYLFLPGNAITVLYGKAGGGFDRTDLSTNGTNVSFAAIADIDGDTWLDVVATNGNGQNDGTVSVFKNNGSGTLALQGTPFSTASNNPAWVGLADVTGDNVVDCIVASFGKTVGQNVQGQNITIFQGHADFTFTGPITTLAPQIQFIPTAAAVADFDGDGIKDIIATVPGVPLDQGQPFPVGSLYIFRGTGGGGFAAPTQVSSAGVFPTAIQAEDVNGDGKLDLVVANCGDPNANPQWNGGAVGVLINGSSSGSISFGTPTGLTANCFGTFAVAVADFDMDGKKDIASVNFGNQDAISAPFAYVSIYLGNGTGTFTAGSPGTYDTQTQTRGGQFLAVGNFDSNPAPDLIVAHESTKVTLLFNTTVVGPGVTINKGASQADPTNGTSIVFDVVFSEGVTGFTNSDVDLSGSSGGGAGMSATVAPAGGSTTAYTVTVTGMSGTGTVKATIPAGAATSIAGSVLTSASTSTDNVVAFDLAAPTVTINQASGQSDPATSGPITFTVVFSESVTGFAAADIDLSSSSLTGLSAAVTGAGANYSVQVTGMSTTGTVVAKVKANAATDAVGNPSEASTSTDNTVIFSVNQPPVITLSTASLTYNENDPATVLDGGATVIDPDSPDFNTGTLTVDYTANGSSADRLEIRNEGNSPGQIGVSGANVAYGGTPIGTFSGGVGTTALVVTLNASATPTAVEALVRNITFRNVSDAPSTNPRTVRFRVSDGDGGTSNAATLTVNVVAVNDPPAIGGTVANQAVNDNATVALFGGVTITDPDVPAQSLTVSVQIGNTANGDFTASSLTASGFNNAGGGLFTFTGTAGNAQTAIRQLVFDPTDNQVAPGSAVSTSFTITANDGVAAPVNNNNTSVNATSVNDAPVIGGAVANQAVNDNANVALFSGVTITDPDVPAQSLTVSVQIGNTVNGVFTASSLTASGFNSAGGGLFTFTGTAANAQTAIRQLIFDPTDNQVAPGSVVSTSFTITTNDGIAAPVSNNNTSVNATSVNDAPVIGGGAADQPVSDKAIAAVFASLTVADPDNETASVTVTILNGVNRGDFTSFSATGWTRAISGADIIYTRDFSGANVGGLVQIAVRALVFDPRENALMPGATEKTVFTVSVDDSGAPVANNGEISALTISVNDLPTGLPRRFRGHTPLRVKVVKGLLVGIADPDAGAQLTTRLLIKPKRGKLRLLPNGAFVYFAPAGFVGRVKFYYVIDDGQGGTSAPIQVTLRVV